MKLSVARELCRHCVGSLDEGKRLNPPGADLKLIDMRYLHMPEQLPSLDSEVKSLVNAILAACGNSQEPPPPSSTPAEARERPHVRHPTDEIGRSADDARRAR